ncbi:MAG: hypothetical protein ACRC33_08075 [Gemmataceae bacterium]
MEWLNDLRPIRLFSVYLAFFFCVSTVLRLRQYSAVFSLVVRLGTRWPNLLRLVLEHRAVLLSWDTVRPLAVMLSLVVLNTAACQLVWPSAGDFRATRLLAMPGLVTASVVAGSAMLVFDLYTLLRVGSFDEKAVEKHFELAESWLRGWKAPAVKVLSLGYVNPRAIVGQEVRAALEGATGWLAGTFRWTAVQTGLRIAFGLTLWLGFALQGWLRPPPGV